MPETEGPFQETDLDEINQRLEELTKAERLMEQAQRAGIDITEQQKRAQELRSRLTRMKQAFFPGR